MMESRQRNPRNFINSLTQQKQILWTPKQLETVVNNITNLRDRAYISFIYLTAAREKEPLQHIKKVKIMEEVKDASGRRNNVWTGEYRTVEVDGFRVNQIMGVTRFNKASKEMIRYIDFSNLYVSKTRKDPSLSIRTVPVNSKIYRRYIEFIYEYIAEKKLVSESLLFKFSARTARTFVNKWVGVPVHFLRHLRLTHLKTLHGYDAIDLQRFVGWKDTRPAHIYVHLDPTDLALKQI